MAPEACCSYPSPCPGCCPISIAARRARSAGDSPSSAAASASTVSAGPVSALLVQAAVQAFGALPASPLFVSLASHWPENGILEVTGSIPVGSTHLRRRPAILATRLVLQGTKR